jgi:hypothetical protein
MALLAHQPLRLRHACEGCFMLGWPLSVYRQRRDRYAAAKCSDQRGTSRRRLANGLDGSAGSKRLRVQRVIGLAETDTHAVTPRKLAPCCPHMAAPPGARNPWPMTPAIFWDPNGWAASALTMTSRTPVIPTRGRSSRLGMRADGGGADTRGCVCRRGRTVADIGQG